MKIILQREAKTISNQELLENQEYLIGLLDKIPGFPTKFIFNPRQQIKGRNSRATS